MAGDARKKVLPGGGGRRQLRPRGREAGKMRRGAARGSEGTEFRERWEGDCRGEEGEGEGVGVGRDRRVWCRRRGAVRARVSEEMLVLPLQTHHSAQSRPLRGHRSGEPCPWAPVMPGRGAAHKGNITEAA